MSTCRTTVAVHFCFFIDKVFTSKLTGREQMRFLYISQHVLIVFLICISEAFEAVLLLNLAFEAVAVYSPSPVLML